jgi:hypothetical protein
MRIRYSVLSALASFAFSLNAHAADATYKCSTVEDSARAHAQKCSFQTSNVYEDSTVSTPMSFLILRGTIDETAYDHGRLLAKEVAGGAVPTVLGEIRKALESMSPNERFVFQKVQACVMQGYRNSVTPEFVRLHERLHDGLVAAGETSLSAQQLLDASLAVELSIFADGFKKKMSDNPLGALAELGLQCGLVVPTSVAQVISGLAGLRNVSKFGCTGIAATPTYTKDGALVFGRNFDSSLVGVFERKPVMIMQVPPKGHRYVGVGSAGLHYAAGISGFNDAGLVVSSHELQTEEYVFQHGGRKAAVGPYVQNMILERAGSIDEAVAVAKSFKHFGAWTTFIADTKTNEIASIEFTGRSFAVARRVQNSARAQTNHFLAPSMVNANFEYSYNKTLESRSRLSFLEKQLQADKGSVDSQWVMNMLASHTDDYVGRRAFGRTATKAYGTMTHVMVPQKREFWLTLGDTFPVPSSTFVGIEVNFDFDKTGAQPFRFLGFRKAASADAESLPQWTRSLGLYTDSYIAFRDRSAANAGLAKSYNLLSEAIGYSENDGVFEVPYHYIRGRVGIIDAASKVQSSQFAAASGMLDVVFSDFDAILEKGGNRQVAVLPYELGLAHLWRARAIDIKLGTVQPRSADAALLQKQRNEHYAEARVIFSKIIETDSRSFYVKGLLKSFYDENSHGFKQYSAASGMKDDIDFVTME